MTDIKRGILEDIAQLAALDDDSLRFSYGGRGMYGKKCFGIVGDASDLARFVSEAAEAYVTAVNEGDDETANDLRPLYSRLDALSTDSMGLDYIFYWTQLQVVED